MILSVGTIPCMPSCITRLAPVEAQLKDPQVHMPGSRIQHHQSQSLELLTNIQHLELATRRLPGTPALSLYLAWL